MSEEWRGWLTALAQTRLKTVVLLADPDQSDAEINQSRAFVAGNPARIMSEYDILAENEGLPENHRSGYVAIVGPPQRG